MSIPISMSSRLTRMVPRSNRCCFSTSATSHSAPRIQPTRPASQAKTLVPRDVYELTQQYPRHPLLAFFNREARKVEVEGNAKGRDEKVPVSLMAESFDQGADSGRAWTAPELRTKSSVELHQLWYACLMERNKLATSKAEIQRAGVLSVIRFLPYKGRHIEKETRKTMTMIKFVLNERRLALLDAQEKAAAQTLDIADELEEEAARADLYEEEGGAEKNRA